MDITEDQEPYVRPQTMDPKGLSTAPHHYTKTEIDLLIGQLVDALAGQGIFIAMPQLPEPFRNPVSMPFNA